MIELHDPQMSTITNISETLLIPLYCRAKETQSKNSVISDRKAVEITEQLNKIFATSTSRLHQRLANEKIRRTANKKLITFLALRSRKFDRTCREFLSRTPNGIIVE